MKEGDKNTRFFHRMTNAHRRRNFLQNLSINEKDLNTIICMFCDKVTKREASIDTNILLVDMEMPKNVRNAPIHVRQEIEDYMNVKKIKRSN